MIQFDDNVERQDEVAIRKIKESGLPVVLWGAGDIAVHIERKLRKHGIVDVYFGVNDAASSAYTIDELDTKLGKYILIPSFAKALRSELDEMRLFRNQCQILYIYNTHEEDVEAIHSTYFNANIDAFQNVYDALGDDKSKRSFDAYFKAKVTDDARDMFALIETPQYFSGEFIKLSDHESLVDCGAYNGDSIIDLLAATGGKYERIFAFEPDENNIAGLRAMIREKTLHNVDIVERGAYDRVTELRFASGGGVYSKIDESGETVIKTDTIDNVVGDRRVTFIKMDIEGAERNALDGAAQTIRRCRPVLALSAYHRSDDIFVLHRRMKELLGDCDFYFRLHKVVAVDAVLYAVPK